jgi:hypothetical protein
MHSKTAELQEGRNRLHDQPLGQTRASAAHKLGQEFGGCLSHILILDQKVMVPMERIIVRLRRTATARRGGRPPGAGINHDYN